MTVRLHGVWVEQGSERRKKTAEKKWGWLGGWVDNLIRLSILCVYVGELNYTLCFSVCRWYKPWLSCRKSQKESLENKKYLKYNKLFSSSIFQIAHFFTHLWIQVYFSVRILEKSAFVLLWTVFSHRHRWWNDSNFINIFCCSGCVKPSLQNMAFSITAWQLLSEVWKHRRIFLKPF